MLFCPVGINTPSILKGVWFKKKTPDAHLLTWNVTFPLSCSLWMHFFPPAALHKVWWSGGGWGRRPLVAHRPWVCDRCIQAIVPHWSPYIWRGKGPTPGPGGAGAFIMQMHGAVLRSPDEDGLANTRMDTTCHSLAHLSPRSGDGRWQPATADESALQPGCSYKSRYETIGGL